ncbi:hypothetical protein MLD38_014028 [Melastoma candidum]|uniref:Uncharacterized protein n=1 Tax=Melastoma candidum TaxID=119954 RepID=A0ACB9RBE5_9MYRT|nr:hypothetical protein MLD38_014028 [Melastoma candidum]
MSTVAARRLPLIDMLERIRRLLMVRQVEKNKAATRRVDILTENVRKEIEAMKEVAARWVVKPSITEKFEVSMPLADSDRFLVDLKVWTCTCRSWELHGIPCTHALSCILYMKRRVEDYVDPCFKMDTYRQAYMHVLHPLEGSKFWPHEESDPIRPPPYKKLPGRPRKQKRKKSKEEDPKTSSVQLSRKGIGMTCKLCGNMGHSRRTCKRQPSSQQSSQPVDTQPNPSEQTTEAAEEVPFGYPDYGSGHHWRVKCKLCGKKGHNRRTCSKRQATAGSSQATQTAEFIPDIEQP